MASVASVSVGTQTTVHDLHLLDNRSDPNPPAPGNTGRLIYANPQDLPSFPSLGLKKNDAAAGAAASLGWANARPLSLWTPAKDASAQTAATLANSYKMPTPGQPERNTAGSKTAAVLAAENASRVPDQRASMPASWWGNSAATQAFAAAGGGDRVEPREPMTELNRQKSLRAAKGAFAGDARPRSNSSPLTYPDSANAAANALSAATMAHRPSTTINLKMTDVGAQPVTSMGSEMYTSNPPVKPEVDEKSRDEALHASAVAMAKKMYAYQQKNADNAKQSREDTSRPGSSGKGVQQQSTQFPNLQEAAYNLAQERLARLQDEHRRNRGMSDYYGTSVTSPTSTGRRLTRLGKLRRRASSDGDVVASLGDDDRQRSRQIRKQMSLFSTKLDQVDESKRTRDREALLAAAQRNVKATLNGMDEKMYRDQGRVPPTKLNEWEAKAHAAAQVKSDARTAGDMTGKVNLGAGQYMDREKVEEIAAKRVQPVLDEINEKAELERQRIVAQREEQEKKRLESETEKAKNAEVKENARKLKGTEEEKHRKEELKEEAKARKEEEKAAKAEEKRLAKEEKDANRMSGVASNEETLAERPLEASPEEPQQHKRRLSRPFTPKIQTKDTFPTKTDKADPSSLSPDTTPESATESPSTRVKNWLKSRLQRPRAKSTSTSTNNTKAERPAGGFIGGHALTRLHADGTGSMTSLSEGNRSASMHEVALAGRPISALPLVRADEEGESYKRQGRVLPSNANDSLSSLDSEAIGLARASRTRARSKGSVSSDIDITPPRAIVDPERIVSRNSASPSRDSKFIEIID
ncbi:Eisosome assembly protein [Gnomoniopsis sp. IMI 355080]|nr:Eisosome assembly protein [Gnomoniopsis sp. IMI 355080]